MNEGQQREGDVTFRTLADASPAGIFIVHGRRLAFVNTAMAAITGYDRDELLGTDPILLLDLSEREGAEAQCAARARGEVSHDRRDVRIRTRTGEERWIDLTTAPLGSQGSAGIIGTGIDISDRKLLEAGVQQRQQYEAVARLAGGVAHDFNNILLVISGEAERIIEGLHPHAPLRASAEAIGRAAERAAVLTEHLLAFGRRQILIARPVDIGAVIAALEPALRDQPNDVIRPILRLAPTLPPVRVDPSRLEQVLLSLLANAREAMPEGGDVVISADLVQVDASMREGRPWLPLGGTWVRLRVADTGPGTPQAVLARVFEPFFTTKRAGAGSGLGLSTVYGIIKQSAGYVWMDSAPGSGACVTILLPPADSPADIAAAAPQVRSSKPKILLVEDQDGVRDLLTTVLERNGFDVVTAASAETALDLVAASSFDVLLTDVVLPGMPGPDLARRVRRQSPRTHVLLMSGYSGDAVLDTDEFGGESAFIQKPFASKALVERLRSLLADSSGDAGSPTGHTPR